MAALGDPQVREFLSYGTRTGKLAYLASRYQPLRAVHLGRVLASCLRRAALRLIRVFWSTFAGRLALGVVPGMTDAEGMKARGMSIHVWLMALAGFVAVSAYGGAVALIIGWLRPSTSMAQNLPFHSPVFAGVALACIVAAPATVVAVLAWRRHPRDRDAATLAGILLVGWIVVEVAVVRQFSALQVIYGLAGVGLIVVGSRHILAEVADAVTALPLLLTAPLYRWWHLRWGATAAEARAVMPGDDLVPVSHFTATRAITIEARPCDVWPWLTQVGYGRAGFYSYDLLDNLGRPSVTAIMPQWQQAGVGDIAAPMASHPSPSTSFRVADVEPQARLVWAKPDSTWAWTLAPLTPGRTRLVTRLRQRYQPTPAGMLTIILAEFGDFAMMRKMLLGIKSRAETGPVDGDSSR